MTLRVTRPGVRLTGTYARSWETPPGRRAGRDGTQPSSPRREALPAEEPSAVPHGDAKPDGEWPARRGRGGDQAGRAAREGRRSRSGPARPAGRRRARVDTLPYAGSRDSEVSMDDPVLSRRSIRRYTDQPVDDATVERLLRAAMAAPSAGNQQPWQFVVLRDRADADGDHGVAPLRQDAAVGARSRSSSAATRATPSGPCCGNRTARPAPRTCSSRPSCSAWGPCGSASIRWRSASRRCARCSASPGPWCRSPSSRSGGRVERKEPSDRYDARRVHTERW